MASHSTTWGIEPTHEKVNLLQMFIIDELLFITQYKTDIESISLFGSGTINRHFINVPDIKQTCEMKWGRIP